MVQSYAEFKSAKQLPKIKKLIQDNNISKEAMVLFLNKEKEKVFTKESVDDIIKRINEFDFDYVKKVLPKLKVKTVKKVKKVPKKKEYSCTAVFYRLIDKDDDTKYKKRQTIKHEGRKYRQVWVTFANVKGDIVPYKDRRTFRPNDEMEGAVKKHSEIMWNNLLQILCTDHDVKETLELKATGSSDFHCIVITNVVEQDKNAKPFDIMEGRLFNETAPKAIYNKDISYNLNEQATNFAEMFDIVLNAYTIDNYKANSCYLNTIVDYWHESFEKIKSDGKRMFTELTFESVCAIVGLTYKNEDIGMALRESEKFYEKFRLGLDVVNVYGEIVFSFRPADGLNGKIFPQVLRILVHNNHVYKLDKKCKNKLDHLKQKISSLKLEDKLIDEVSSLEISNKFKLRKPVLDDSEIHFINDLDECVNTTIQSKCDKIKFITNNDLTNILFQMVGSDYTPSVCFTGLNLLSLAFKVGTKYATIQNTDPTAPEDTIVQLDSKEHYETYHKANDEFYFKILQTNLKSSYPESVLEIEHKYPMGPISGYLTKELDKNAMYNAIDTVKAYTDCLRKIRNVPVFDYFDEYKTYDNHLIEAYTMYFVEVHAEDNIAQSLLFPTVFYRAFGFKLLRCQQNKIYFKIHSFRRPANLEEVNYEDPVNEVYSNNKLSVQNKKDIVNRTTGLCEKKYNSASVCKVFDNLSEARHYQLKYNAKLYSLQQSFTSETNVDPVENPLNFGLDMSEFSSPNVRINMNYSKAIHLVVVEKKEMLVEGYRYIKEMIYDLMSLKMYDLYNEVVSKGIVPKGIKTDAILVTKSKSELSKLFEFDDSKIGGLKFESGKYCNDRPVKQIVNEPFIVQNRVVNEIKIIDEYDKNEIKDIFDKHDKVLIKGLFPGVGKTTSVLNYENHKILFVPPFNKLAQQIRTKGHNAATLNMLLGFYGEGEEYTHFKGSNIDEYDCICFDEVMINPPNILKKIDLFMKQHPDKKYLPTGDVNQLQPINWEPNNISDKRAYLTSCLDRLFPNQITLQINKRLKTQEQKDKLIQLQTEIFDTKKNVMDTLKKHGFKIISKFSDIQTTSNICYFNFRTNEVNKYVHKTLIKAPKETVLVKGVTYWKDLELTCKKRYKEKGKKLFVNYTYKLDSLTKSTFKVTDVVEGTYCILPIAKLDDFSLPYANTCHSVQGLSIDKPMTIFDVNTPYVDRFFVWTALTRATDFNNVTIFEHPKTEISSLYKSKVKQYFDQKVESYKKQDKIAGRKWDKEVDDYVDADWFNDEYFKLQVKSCIACRIPYEPPLIDCYGIVHSNITADRINNKLPHTQINCRLLCKQCNCTRGNKY